MLKRLIETYIRNSRAPDFRFDATVDSRLLTSLSLTKAAGFVRGLRLFFSMSGFGPVFLGRGVALFNRRNIRLGKNVSVGDYSRLSALGRGPLQIGNNVSLGAFTQVVISTTFADPGNTICIGDNVGIGEFSYLGGAGGLHIDSDTIVGQYFSTHPENHNFADNDELIRLQGVERKGIRVGRNCWIGAKVTLVDGVSIGDNCVIAAGSVVTESMPDNVVVAGVPARILRSR